MDSRKQAWVNIMLKSVLADLQLEWPHTADDAWMESDGELTLVPAKSTDSLRLIVTWPEQKWYAEICPSSYVPNGDIQRFAFSSREDAVTAAKMFKCYYDTVVIPNMENM